MAVTLAEFLLARIAEDEAVAQDALVADIATVAHEHMARWNPDRALAECEAKRRIVALHPPRWAVAFRDSERLLAEAFDHETVKVEASSGPIYDPELRLLAVPYADHPDYDKRWVQS